jgi:small redox-active disulfide protein 2
MLIKILGAGCANCTALEQATRDALTQLGLRATVEHVTDFPTIASYSVLSTPALVVDEQVLLTGRVPPVEQLRTLLREHATNATRTEV